MIPACYPIGVEPIDTKELTGHTFEELDGLDDEKLVKTLTSTHIRIFSKYSNVIDGPNRDDEQLKIIKNYRIFLNGIFNNVRASPEDLVSTEITCERLDFYWAKRERYLTDNMTYIFATVNPPIMPPR